MRLEDNKQQVKADASTGIIRRVDDLGRITIPKEIRRRYGIQENTPLELFPTRDGILFKVYRMGDGIRSIIKTAKETVKETIDDYADEIGDDEYNRILQEAEDLCQFIKSKKEN